MKNKVKTGVLLFLIMLTLGSCNKSLTIPVKNGNTYDSYFNNDVVLNQAVIADYAVLLHQGLWSREWYFTIDLLGYDAKPTANMQGDLLQLAQMNFGFTQPQIDQTWASLYRIIYRANLVIDRTTAWTPGSDAEKAHQKQYLAEAKFLRAFAYFDLVNLWGRVPLHLSFKDYTNNVYPKRADIPAVWAVIEQDLKDAEAGLPVTYAATDLGRATSGAATALLGKSYLYEKKWAAAQAEFTKLAQAPYSYALVDNYTDNFSSTKQTNSEMIFQVINRPFSSADGGNQYYVFGGQESWGGKATNSDRAQEYGFNDWDNCYITTAAVKAFTYPNPVNGTPYVDKRAAYTFYGDAPSGGQTLYCQACDTIRPYPFAAKKYQFLKYEYYDLVKSYGGPASGINGQVIRYADVLLMLAEANIQIGNNAGALTLINQVRGRKSVNAVPYASLGTQDQAMAILMRERQLEFTGEQSRYFDLIRWGLAKQTLNSERLVEENTQPFQDKNLLLPIPISERSTNPNISADIKNDWN